MHSQPGKFLPLLENLEYMPLLAQSSVAFKKSQFSVYKLGANIIRTPELFAISAVLGADVQSRKELALSDLYCFFLRDNCDVSDWYIDSYGKFKTFSILPLKVKQGLLMRVTTDVSNDAGQKVIPEINKVISIPTNSRISMDWPREEGGYDRHSYFACRWA